MNNGNVDASTDTLPKIGTPATRALHDAGYTALRELAGVPRTELAALHGMGPKALDIIQAALEKHDLSLG
jgi:3-deoxy-D-arabino-heptulosonate 7-phosphate (DAHP) synthase